MKISLTLLSAACGLAFLAGCSSPSSSSARLRETASAAALPADTQKKLEDGVVEVGYTADMVYVALGRPSKVSVTTDGRVGIWTYANYLPSEAVSSTPFYALRGGYRGRPAFRDGPSSAGAKDGGAMGNISRGNPSGGPAGLNWPIPDVTPVTLHVLFAKGRVVRFAVNDGA